MSETLAAAPAPVPPISPPASRRKLLIAIIAGGVVLLLLIAAGAWAIATIFLGKNESATASAVAFPASTVSWSEVAIDPSNDQKLGALGFVTALDGLKEAIEDSDLDIDFDDPASNTDIKGALWDFLVESDGSGFEDVSLDYEDDIKPWLGSRLAYGTLPSDDPAEPQLIVAIEAKDTSAGVDAVEELLEDLELGEIDLEVSERNGYVLVSPDYVDLDEAFEDGTLADAKSFASAAENAGGWGLVSYWSDLGSTVSTAADAYTSSLGDYTDRDYWEQQILDNSYSYIPYPEYDYDAGGYIYEGVVFQEYEEYEEFYLDVNLETLVDEKLASFEGLADAQESVVEQFDGVTAYGVLRFTDGALELSGSVDGLKEQANADTGGNPLGALPDSTMLAISISGIAPAIDSALGDDNLSLLGLIGGSYFGGTDPISREDVVDFFDENLGIEFPDDLDVLFGNQLIVSLDEDLDLDALSGTEGGNFAALPESGAAITIISDDADATLDAWEDLISRFEDQSGAEFGLDLEADGNRVVISAGDYLDTVLEPSDTTGDSDIFRRALPQADGASGALYINVAQFVDLLSGDAGAPDEFTDLFDGLEAIGVTTTATSKDSTSILLRVTTERD